MNLSGALGSEEVTELMRLQRAIFRALPSFFTAIQDQLGLILESQKGPVETLVIEHVDKPSKY
jgi:uncharacterized protein (TIGR03435 family)